MYLGFSFFLWIYIISCLAVIIGTYIAFKTDDTIEHTLYNFFDTDEMYGFFFCLAFVPLVNITISITYIIIGLSYIYFYIIHNRLVKICKKIKI